MFETVKCGTCDEQKKRKFLKNMPRGAGVRKVYVDQLDRQWLFGKCPDCRYGTPRKTIKSKRRCQRCNEQLKVNYFYCSPCLAEKEKYAGWDLF